MSNTGLHAGFYDEIRAFSELVDAVITDMSVGTAGALKREELAGRLTQMTQPGSGALLLRYLGPGSIVARKKLADLAGALKESPPPVWVPERLEILARLLDGGRSSAVARLHGDVR